MFADEKKYLKLLIPHRPLLQSFYLFGVAAWCQYTSQANLGTSSASSWWNAVLDDDAG